MIANVWTQVQLFFLIAAALGGPAALGMIILASLFVLTAIGIVVAGTLLVVEKIRERRERAVKP